MKIIYCCDPLNDGVPDPMFIDEVAAATRAGLSFELIDFGALTDQDNPARAVRDVPMQHGEVPAVYRGWRMTVPHYRSLYEALHSRGIQLINNPRQYEHTHYLPRSYSLIEEHTAPTIWIDTDGTIDIKQVMQQLAPFGDSPLILKDFVKSNKHYWKEACYIQSASDEQAVKQTIQQFMKLQGDDLEGGLVFRQFVPLQSIGKHQKSGMPLSREYRLFYLNNFPILTARYWDVEDVEDTPPLTDDFDDLAMRIRSRFFTMDVAQRADGEWMVLELGDAQTAQLPHSADENLFYQMLAGAR